MMYAQFDGLNEAIPAVERIGIGPALLVMIILFLMAVTWRVLPWIGKRIDRVVAGHTSMSRVIKANDSRHVNAMEAIAEVDQKHHTTTHGKVEALHAKVDEVHKDVKRALPRSDRGG